ncbi:MAG TPA: GxxExxY protein [Terriglobales bacterium]|nr:GxxExxY protein [Terriglobales bacterium]
MTSKSCDRRPCPWCRSGVKLDCEFRADLVVEGRVVIELKCKEALHPVDEAQLLSHLRFWTLRSACSSTFTWYSSSMASGVW